mgnify:FL=1
MDKKVIIIIVITLFFALKKIRKIIGPLLLVLVFLFLFNNIKNIKSFFQTPKNEESTYSFLTLKNSDINTKENLKNKKIGYIESFMPVEIDEYVLKSYDANNIYNVLLKKEVDAIYISDSYLSVLKEEYKDILEQTKIVEEEKVESVISIKESKNRDIINIFISGTDSKKEKITSKSRSDVNIILTINRKENKVLITSIPRDYYVELFSNKKDKLTHCGVYGITVCIETLNKLLDIEINYFLKINMNAFTKVIDLLNGITLKDGTKLTSEEALKYVRERYSYKEGDRKRVENNQDILEEIIKSFIRNKSLLLNYKDILESLNGYYMTNIDENLIVEVIKNLLLGKSLKIERQILNGFDSYDTTYSIPNKKLYVMLPDDKSLETAREKLKNMLP